jgi:hypothetical protein
MPNGHRFFARVDEVGFFVAFVRVRTHAEDPVLTLQHDGDVVRHVIGNERRKADP